MTDYLVRLGPPAKGDTIHRSTCRYARKPNALRWVYADKNPGEDWAKTAPWLKRCQVCLPPSPLLVSSDHRATPDEPGEGDGGMTEPRLDEQESLGVALVEITDEFRAQPEAFQRSAHLRGIAPERHSPASSDHQHTPDEPGRQVSE